MVILAAITLSGILKVVTFLVMLSVLVVLHEYGHFIVARLNGVKVNEFAVGMGPKVFGWTSPRTGTLFALRALPLGGFCAMDGEDNKTTESEQRREYLAEHSQRPRPSSFQSKSTLRRLAIVLAGPFANFFLCFVLLLVAAVVFGVPSDRIDRAVVLAVLPGTPAAKLGLRAGDHIVAVRANGADITQASALVGTIHRSLGKRISITYERDGVAHSFVAVPVPCPGTPKNGCIGFEPIAAYEHVGLSKAIGYSGSQFVNIADQAFASIGMLVTKFTKYAGQISGPVAIGQAAGVVQEFGWGPYLGLSALVSFSLGVFNLLPLPALDGGRAAFILVEMLRGKPVDPEKEAFVHLAGFAALMVFMLVVAFHDITRIASGKGMF